MSRTHLMLCLRIYQWLAGLCDATAGLLLIFAPGFTLALLGVHQRPASPDFVSFVGVFVLSVGLAYFYAAWRPLNADHVARWRAVWWLTALSRTLVAVFLAWKIVSGHFEMAWIGVALTDGALAIFQWTGLRAGWLRFHD